MSSIKTIQYVDAKQISDKIIDMYFSNEFDKCLIFYNKFKSIISQIPKGLELVKKNRIRMLTLKTLLKIIYFLNLNQMKKKY